MFGTLALRLGLQDPAAPFKGGLVPPSGFAFVTYQGAYVTSDGAYVMQRIA